MDASDSIFSVFLRDIGLATNIDEMFTALEKASCILGFDNLSFTFAPLFAEDNLKQLSPIFLIAQSYEKEFITYYLSEKPERPNLILKRIKNGDRSLMIWWVEPEENFLARKDKRVIRVVRNGYSMRHGITIPTYNGPNGIACVSVTSADKDDVFSMRRQERLEKIRVMAQIFNDRILISPQIRYRFMVPFLQTLTDTEKNVLKKLSQGYAPKAIAHDLNSSQKYVSHIITKLREKFGGITRDQLLYTAGLIAFDELTGFVNNENKT